MTDFRLQVSGTPSDQLLERLGAGLTEHAAPFVEAPGFQPLTVTAMSPIGELAGAVTGRVNWNWLHVSLLWVRSESRGEGLGGVLLGRIENEARAMGCARAHLDTFSYQAPDFYRDHGYREFARLTDYPPGHARIFLSKDL